MFDNDSRRALKRKAGSRGKSLTVISNKGDTLSNQVIVDKSKQI